MRRACYWLPGADRHAIPNIGLPPGPEPRRAADRAFRDCRHGERIGAGPDWRDGIRDVDRAAQRPETPVDRLPAGDRIGRTGGGQGEAVIEITTDTVGAGPIVIDP